VLAFGVSFAVLTDRWAARWPVPALSVRGVLSVLPFFVVLALSLTLGVPAVVMVVVVSVAAWRQGRSARPGRWLERSELRGGLVVRANAVLAWIHRSVGLGGWCASTKKAS